MNHITQEQAIALAKDKGALVENWMTNPPRVGLMYLTPEQLHELCNASIELYIAQQAESKELKHKYELELPDGDTRKAKVWWTERKTNDGALIHKLSISVDETPSTIQAAPTKEQT